MNAWDDRPIVFLLAHLAERHDAELAELERLQRVLAKAKMADDHDRILAQMAGALSAIERVARRHVIGTAAALFPHVTLLEVEADGRRFTAAVAARLVHRLRLDHEAVGALLESARRCTDDYRLPAGAPRSLRELYEGMITLERSAHEHARLESTTLIRRVFALDPSIERDATPVALPTRRREILSANGQSQEISVFCPTQRRSFDLEWCCACPFVRRVSEVAVECTPHGEMPEPREGTPRIGDASAVGAAMGEYYVTAGSEVSVDVIARALEDAHTQAALVVDDTDRLVGAVRREDARISPANRRAKDLVEDTPCIHESASLADAFARMAKTHKRFLPVLDSNERVVGLLSDIDALHWVARHNKADKV
jgi:iron-sulfur cluster repair protein YtfE (RIC family)/CBS domain-containing protein